MSEEFVSDSGSGTANVATEGSVDSGRVDQVVSNQTEGTGEVQETPDDRIRVLEDSLAKQRREATRMREYNEFLRQSQQFRKKDNSNVPDISDIDPDSVPLASDVDRIIEARLHAKLQAIEEERALSELSQIGNQRRAADPNFDKVINMAFEVIGTDPDFFEPFVMRHKSGAERIKELERIARQHPLFEETRVVPNVAATQNVVDKIKNNLSMPPTLSSIQGVGSSGKAIKDMTLEEYLSFKESVKAKL